MKTVPTIPIQCEPAALQQVYASSPVYDTRPHRSEMETEERVLIIDGDEALSTLLVTYLEREGFKTDIARDGQEGCEMASSGAYSLCMLDIMLPGGRDGLPLLKEICTDTDVPVIVVTARTGDTDRIAGLETGADDYLAKPFNPRELVARMRAVLRRAGHGRRSLSGIGQDMQYRVGDVVLDIGTRTAVCAKGALKLTAVEFEILKVLLRHAGCTVKREDLSRDILERPLSPHDRSIDVHVSRLRKKLGPGPDGTDRIRSIRSSGYLYVLPPRDCSCPQL